MTSVELRRTFAASPAAVYRAWLDPTVLARWAAPVGWGIARVEVDERVGGHYRCWHVDPEGRDAGGFECEIVELVPGERIVLRWDFVGPDRRPLADASSRLTITLGPVEPDACELTLVHDRLDGLERQMPGMTDATRGGWSGTLGRLEGVVGAGPDVNR
jgi:uncharacterized protein YndB with AHSA1/START domain